MSCNENGCCTPGCENASDEIKKIASLVAKLVEDYGLAITGNKKRTTEARKTLLEIKKLSGEMRKIVFEKNKKARAASPAPAKAGGE